MNPDDIKIKRHGYNWYPYTVQFESPDGTFMFGIWAISDDHAELQVQAIKETAIVKGRLIHEDHND